MTQKSTMMAAAEHAEEVVRPGNLKGPVANFPIAHIRDFESGE